MTRVLNKLKQRFYPSAWHCGRGTHTGSGLISQEHLCPFHFSVGGEEYLGCFAAAFLILLWHYHHLGRYLKGLDVNYTMIRKRVKISSCSQGPLLRNMKLNLPCRRIK